MPSTPVQCAPPAVCPGPAAGGELPARGCMVYRPGCRVEVWPLCGLSVMAQPGEIVGEKQHLTPSKQKGGGVQYIYVEVYDYA